MHAVLFPKISSKSTQALWVAVLFMDPFRSLFVSVFIICSAW